MFPNVTGQQRAVGVSAETGGSVFHCLRSKLTADPKVEQDSKCQDYEHKRKTDEKCAQNGIKNCPGT